MVSLDLFSLAEQTKIAKVLKNILGNIICCKVLSSDFWERESLWLCYAGIWSCCVMFREIKRMGVLPATAKQHYPTQNNRRSSCARDTLAKTIKKEKKKKTEWCVRDSQGPHTKNYYYIYIRKQSRWIHAYFKTYMFVLSLRVTFFTF